MNLANPVTLALWSAMAPAAAWGVHRHLRERGPRTWDIRWHDQPTGRTRRKRRRNVSGADSIRGAGIYEMYDADGRCAYVGQALNPRKRFASHAKDYQSDVWVRGVVRSCPWWRLSDMERERIAALDPYQNETRGGSKQVTFRQWFRHWRRERQT